MTHRYLTADEVAQRLAEMMASAPMLAALSRHLGARMWQELAPHLKAEALRSMKIAPVVDPATGFVLGYQETP